MTPRDRWNSIAPEARDRVYAALKECEDNAPDSWDGDAFTQAIEVLQGLESEARPEPIIVRLINH